MQTKTACDLPHPAQVLLLYARESTKDRAMALELTKRFAALESEGIIKVTGYHLAAPGSVPHLLGAAAQPRLVLALVSADFCAGVEATSQVREALRSGVRVFTVLLSQTDVLPELTGLRTLPSQRTLRSARDRDAAYLEVVQAVRGELLRQAFAAVRERIAALRDHKLIHDQLHQLKFHHPVACASARRELGDQDVQVALEGYHAALQCAVAILAPLARCAPFLQELIQAEQDLDAALQQRSDERRERALTAMQRILARSPTKISARIEEAMRALQLEEIERTIAAAPCDALSVGLKQFIDRARLLPGKIHEHTLWQDVECELAQLSLSAERDRSLDRATWSWIKQKMEALYEPSAEPWAEKLRCLAHQVESADVGCARSGLRAFRREVGFRFFKVDLQVKADLQELHQLGEALHGRAS